MKIKIDSKCLAMDAFLLVFFAQKFFNEKVRNFNGLRAEKSVKKHRLYTYILVIIKNCCLFLYEKREDDRTDESL